MKATARDIAVVLGYATIEEMESDLAKLTEEERKELWEIAALEVPF